MALRRYLSETIIIDISTGVAQEYTGPWPDPLKDTRLRQLGTRATLQAFKLREGGSPVNVWTFVKNEKDVDGKPVHRAGLVVVGGPTPPEHNQIKAQANTWELPDITWDLTLSSLANPARAAIEQALAALGVQATLSPLSRSWEAFLQTVFDELEPGSGFRARDFQVADGEV